MKRHILLTALLWMGLTSLAQAAEDKVFNILDYGAKPWVLSTDAIQAAIDACHEAGEGRVVLPKGNYKTGTLFLKSNVHLDFEDGVTLYGSSDLKDYADVPVATEEPHFSKCLFYVRGAENITITGQDTSVINGQGYFFKHSPERPKLFRIEQSKNIRFENITVKNSGSWCIYFGECDNIRMTRVSVYNKENHNNDGMNYDGCSNVWIKDCNLQVEDDAICLKSSVARPCENINIEGCTVSSYHAAFKLGTASGWTFKDISIKNCRFYDCRYGAIKLLMVDGGMIDNVHISDIELFNCGGPIFLRLGNRGRDYTKSIRQVYDKDVKPEGRPVGSLKNVYIGNITGHLYGRNNAVEGVMFTGIPGHYIENVTMENIDLSFSGHGEMDTKDLVVPEDEARYPEQSFFGPLNSYGLFIRHAKNVTLKNIQFSLRGHDSRPAIYLEDAINCRLENVELELGEGVDQALMIKDAPELKLKRVTANGKRVKQPKG
ncbi:glycoside hydrolase family 28 protein [Coraliomargarita akajimensis]|uniref:Glycoside hydrolase family 28 n=1 Tax=Coraliomargarita akajimensis (strain DSM 45221 / IAM 15411 / JCM 23193 / KCTC 12865 / 04OKA010-24) TaxID=583355 RepID=D5EN48_CORAD|nr:glycosyl hydrolase family 28 protein [Coraliomargarita akajimensis]ADE53483.1 glycoside hydrolase family 28 [Coraliomargarita akajimensis DSM 45221]